LRKGFFVLKTPLPTNPKDLSVDILNAVIHQHNPQISLVDFVVTESHVVGGGQASSAGRMVIRPTYDSSSPPNLPSQIIVKVANKQESDGAKRRGGNPLYANEVKVYTLLKPATFLEAPVALGGAYDPHTNTLLLLLEDLRERGATFANVAMSVSLQAMRLLLDQVAILHARYWESTDFDSSLGWMERHTRGDLYTLFNTPEIAPRHIAHQVRTEQFKREMVQRLGTTVDELFQRLQSVQRHQAQLPQTICHGDTHIGNTYALPDDRRGLLDWQLTSQGFGLHDVSYLLATGLSIEERRAHERALLGYYREQLIANGVKHPPSLNDLWPEYCRAMIWGVYIGWLTTPVDNYGWKITVMNHLRVMTAYEDLGTSKLVDALR
jgi:hypothetical protein